ncbi:MAG: DUF1570 domain-containing protein, partial [bacterium]|nr:DUF1570 domain-containing protein [bacterium]
MSRLATVVFLLAVIAGHRPVRAGDGAKNGTEAETPAEEALLARTGPGFHLRRTERFLIAYDTPHDTLRSLVSRLEATYDSVYRFCKINEIPTQRQADRLEVLFFDGYETFGRYADSVGFAYWGSAGFYDQRTNVAAFVNVLHLPNVTPLNNQVERHKHRIERLRAKRPIDRRALREANKKMTRLVNQRDRLVEQTNRMTVQHETAHQVLFNAGLHVFAAQNPGWLVEGLACLFETPPSSSGAGVGATNQARLDDFRRSLGNGKPGGRIKVEALQEAYADGKMLPLGELIGDANLFSRRNNPNLVHHYSQSWSLVCYLQRRHREKFADYLRLLSRREVGCTTTPESEIGDFERIFGPLSERFERQWARFILQLPFKPGAAG